MDNFLNTGIVCGLVKQGLRAFKRLLKGLDFRALEA